MEPYSQLDAAGGAAISRLKLTFVFLILILGVTVRGSAQTGPPVTDRISEVKQLYDEGRWADVVQTVPDSDTDIADLNLYRGLALARLLRLEEARKTFETGLV